MRIISLILLLVFTFQYRLTAQNISIQELLGYSEDAKLLIIHADDLGMSHSKNSAAIKSMEEGVVNSASIMVPTPWFPEIADYAKNNPEMDFGLHLTLTSEWKFLKWRPITPYNEVPGLVDDGMFFYENRLDFNQHSTPQEVEKELRAQIELAKQFGINITHLDTHMFSLYSRPEYVEIYKKLGHEYGIPVLLQKDYLNITGVRPEILLDDTDIITDHIHMAAPDNYASGLNEYYSDVLKNLEPGLNVILLHPGFDNDEMQAATTDHINYGADWRQKDFDFFSSDLSKELISDNDIQLITWKEIKEKLIDENE